MSDELAGQVAIVTGAGRGIGLAIGRRLAHEGAHVTLGELIAERGEAAASSMRDEGLGVEAAHLDVTSAESCRRVVETVTGDHGRLDILVNNAGVAHFGPSEDLTEELWRMQIDVMLTGTFLMTQAAARRMIPRRSGTIINVASVGGMGGWPMRTAYNPAKAGVICLTEVLATEWAQHEIRVNAISPGVTRTEMVEKHIRDGDASLERYTRRTPMGRLGDVEEIAAAAAFLASSRARFVTGANLVVDGGFVPYGNLDAVGFPEDDR